ncbi:odorant receptor Or2-like [Tribolium madens]|uniref:odorant receptor Or2-like n=1 Tax=Tribolium madens TaxID=41895 RepID=UPI001CF72EAE|nr:odorant receptor Or2-like [Tribolium madens]
MENALKLLDTVGLNPLKNDKTSKFKYFICFSCIIWIIISAVLEIVSNIGVFEILLRDKNASQAIIPPLQTLLKMSSFLFLKKEIVDLLEKTKCFWKLDQCDDETTKQKLTQIHKYVTIFFYVYTVLMTVVCLQLGSLTLIVKPGKPIFLCYGGSDGLESPQYEIYAIVDIFGTLLIGIIVSAYDGMCFYFTLYIYTEFKLLKIAFKRKNGQTVFSYDQQFIQAAKHHDFLLNFINQLNDVISPICLYQFFSSLLGICLCLFLLTAEGMPPKPDTFLTYFIGLMGFVAQTYAFCHIGNLISELSMDISNDIFYVDWLDDEVYRNKTARLIIMNRAQKPAKLTIGKFADMNLRTFILILRNAYSFLAFMNNMLD